MSKISKDKLLAMRAAQAVDALDRILMSLTELGRLEEARDVERAKALVGHIGGAALEREKVRVHG